MKPKIKIPKVTADFRSRKREFMAAMSKEFVNCEFVIDQEYVVFMGIYPDSDTVRVCVPRTEQLCWISNTEAACAEHANVMSEVEEKIKQKKEAKNVTHERETGPPVQAVPGLARRTRGIRNGRRRRI